MPNISLYITKASLDPDTGVMRWAATASDTQTDLQNERMSMELFQSFIKRLDNAGADLPSAYKSEAWSGGLPYLGISHYMDLNGKGIIGDTESVYIDGKMLKAKGTFRNTPLGKKAFEAVRKQIKSKSSMEGNPVRISIGFYDLQHRHLDSGVVFRNTGDTVCEKCSVQKFGDKEYLDGVLVHLALTRIPANVRTDIIAKSEVEDMATRKDDAESIVGEELAGELEKAELTGKSTADELPANFVVREETPEAVADTEDDEVCKACGSKKKKPQDDSMKSLMDAVAEIREKMNTPVAPVVKSLITEEHALYKSIAALVETFDGIMKSEGSADDKLKTIQPVFEAVGAEIVAVAKSVPLSEKSVDAVVETTVQKAVSDAMKPLQEQIALMAEKMGSMTAKSSVPAPRNQQSMFTDSFAAMKGGKMSQIETIARKSVGL